MTTTTSQNPITPAPVITLLPTWVHTWINLVKAHEKMVAILISGFLIFHFYGKTIDTWYNYEKGKSNQAKQVVIVDDQKTKILAAQLATMQKQYDTTIRQLQADLVKSQTDLAAREAQDAVLPLPELASHWADLVVAPASSVVSNPNGTVTVTGDVAHTTVSELEKVPALTEQLLDTQNELQGCTKLSTEKDAVIAQGTKDLTDEKASHAQDVKTLTAKARKSWLSGFKWGAVAGFVGGIFIGHKI